MNGILQLVLITILAVIQQYTANTATYHYDSEYVNGLIADFKQHKATQVKTANADVEITWKFLEDYSPDLVFEVLYKMKSTEKRTCDGGPTLSIVNGSIYCLHQMSILSQTVEGKQTLQLGLFIKHSEDAGDLKIVHSDVFEKPEIKLPPGVAHVTPITEDQLSTVRENKRFTGPANWVKDILDGGMYYLNVDIESKPGENTKTEDDEGPPLYVTHPVVIDAGILGKILDLSSQNTKKNAGSSKKSLFNVWNKSGKHKLV